MEVPDFAREMEDGKRQAKRRLQSSAAF